MVLQKLTSFIIFLHITLIFFLVTPPSPISKKSPLKIRTALSPTISSAVKKPSSLPSSSVAKKIAAPSSSQQKKASSQPQRPQQSRPKPPSAPSSSKTQLPPSSSSSSISPSTKKTPPPLKKSTSLTPKVRDSDSKATPTSSNPTLNGSSSQAWKEIEEALAKIEKTSYPKVTLTSQEPSFFQTQDPQKDEGFEEEETSSLAGAETEEELLITFLYRSLHLPESGDVKVSLTLNGDGTVKKMAVLNAESKKNKLYLEQNLPKLCFPVNLTQEKTWIFNFCHEF
ncbi:MAG: hypothetical protein QRY72_05080 [Candidatus Rhabdochlamydia sp.]